jgi:primosomal protein N' (replication factor Y)
VQLTQRFDPIPQRKKSPPVALHLDTAGYQSQLAWISRSALRQQRLAPFLATPDSALETSSHGGYTSLKDFITRGILVPFDQPNHSVMQPASVNLSEQQQAIVDFITPTLATNHYAPFLLHGVTGSGKTEVYFALIDHCIAAGNQVLVLVPEIALTTQIAQRFVRRFPGKVVVIHGQIHLADRHQGWQQAAEGSAKIILGPRSALAVPIPRLGLIIVDEEHDSSYKSDRAPYFHARDTAMVYARFAKIPILLGSATPSVELMYACQNNAVEYLQLKDRVGLTGMSHERPPIRIVDMRGTTCVDAHGLVSTVLYERISTTIGDNAHVMLLLNRRGATGSRICRNCGTVAMCPRCSSPLVGHGSGNAALAMCHTCGFRRNQDAHCQSCFHRDFLDIGSGTQRVVQVLQLLFPTIPILQWDRDTTDTAKAHTAMLAEIQQHPAAIIVGTQMIAKGLDLERVRLVGVVNADLALHLPDFRATERTYQLLTQVAGRAGRRAGDASVVFQSYTPDNYAIQTAARYDDTGFYENELSFRSYMEYPPYQRMARLIWQNGNDAACGAQAQEDARAIASTLAEFHPETRTIGPTPAFFHKVRDKYHWQMLIVGPSLRAALNRTRMLHRAIIDMDPTSTL